MYFRVAFCDVTFTATKSTHSMYGVENGLVAKMTRSQVYTQVLRVQVNASIQ